jgi:hypothetical protein
LRRFCSLWRRDASRVDDVGIKANLPAVLQALLAGGLQDRAMVLMALSTIRAEAESFTPESEGLSRYSRPSGRRPGCD